jgi:hypothetical protein
MLYDVAQRYAQLGQLDPARAALRQAAETVEALDEREANPGGVITLVPMPTLLTGHLAWDVARSLAAVGGEKAALRWAGTHRSPFVRALAILGVVEAQTAVKQEKDGRSRTPPRRPGR